MAIDMTTGQGTSGHPSRQRPVYVIDKTLDWAAALVKKGSALAAADIFEVLDVPAETMVLAAGAEIVTVCNATAATIDVDFAGGDDYVDGFDAVSAVGYCDAGTNGWVGLQMDNGAQASTLTNTAALRITTADTIDVTLKSLTGTASTGKVRVYAVLLDISGVNEKTTLATSS